MAEIGTLNVPYETTSIVGTTGTITNRFPTPPSSFGFLADPAQELDIPNAFDVLTPPYLIGSALSLAGPYLEPTIGQIWPRNG